MGTKDIKLTLREEGESSRKPLNSANCAIRKFTCLFGVSKGRDLLSTAPVRTFKQIIWQSLEIEVKDMRRSLV